MAESVTALLELWSIDQRRRKLSQVRDAAAAVSGRIEATWKTAEAAATAAKTEADRLDALIRQYTADVERCDKQIAVLAEKKLGAKSNKEYMDIHNGIELARSEKTQREQSVKEQTLRQADLAAKAQVASDKAAATKADFEAAAGKVGAAGGPTPEEQELETQAETIKVRIEPEFLQSYERLIKSGHKTPLMRVDPQTRTTPVGAILSHNQVEQIRQGKLVIDRGTNSILYIG